VRPIKFKTGGLRTLPDERKLFTITDDTQMNIWPTETALLVRIGACLAPFAAGMLIAEGLAVRTRMFGTARLWGWLAGITLGLVTLCFLAGLVCWAWFDWGSARPI
jgi:hypothetical protein